MESQNKIISKSKFSSLISKPRDEFMNLFKKYNELNAKNLYLQILNEIEKTISFSNVVEFKKLSNIIDCISKIKKAETLQTFNENPDNPLKKTNVIILSCKHNKVEILQHLFDEKNNLLEQLAFDIENNLPKRKDDEIHNAFYYAIRSGNPELLETLINKWPGDYFASNLEELDEILSKAYEELKQKNVTLTEEIIVFVENKLINLRFFSNGKKVCVDVLDNIKERINLVVENISLLNVYLNAKIDIRFLHIAKFVAQNIHILKRQLRCSYARLPWEEIEFCLISFISFQTKQQEINLFYQATLNKHKLLNHLDCFAKNLEKEKERLDLNAKKLSDIPNTPRVKVISRIMLKCPEFKELYSDYQKIADVYSLEKISNYIKLALLADPKEKPGQLIITRVLQVMGESFKNTLESPKLSESTSELLLSALPQNTRKIIIDLRNSISHTYSLSRRSEIEKTASIDFFIGVQNDSKKIGNVITDILVQKKIKTLQLLLIKIINVEDIDELKEITNVLNNFEVEKMLSTKFVMSEITRLEVLLQKLRKCIDEKRKYEHQILEKIEKIVSEAKTKSESSEIHVIEALAGIKALSVFLGDKIDIKGLKFRANFILKNLNMKMEPRCLKEIVNQLKEICLTLHIQDQNEVRGLLCEIFFVVEQTLGNVKWIDELRERLNPKPSSTPSNKSSVYKVTKEKYKDQLALKLTELKSTLSNKKTSSVKTDPKLQVIIEMLVLDILSIISSSKKHLENNIFFLDDNSPLLTGKCLRNHLAHYNAIVDISLFNPSLSVLLNAEKLTTNEIYNSKNKLGKAVTDDPHKLKVKFDEDLATLTNQELLFAALEEGDFEKVKDCLQKGADIHAKNINSLTTLDLAVIGSNIEIIKFLYGLNVKGENLLHIAAANGKINVVDFFITELNLDIDEVDHLRKTPLHVAALNGHLEVVKFLLNHDAYINCGDIMGLTPLFYAVRKNQINVVEFLLDKSDINYAMGGYTLLHEAAENGYLELVKVLLENKAHINAKNERNWTPLHAAAYNGYLEIVKVFVQNGADVNGKVINGCTALYYAVENGNENIVDLLVKHGANVNVFERSSNTTPLHTACREGKEQIVKILLENNAEANASDKRYFTPLHLAAKEGHLGIVHLLLKYGAYINAKSKNLCTSLHLAVENGHQEIVELLIKNNAFVDAENENGATPVHYAAFGGHNKIFDFLLNHKCNIKAKDIYCNTPLHKAVIKDSKYIVESLIKNKCEIDAKNKFNMTPLHTASYFGSIRTAEILVKHGATINCVEENHNTPLHLAVQEGHTHIIKLLLKHNSNINAENIDQQTPLDIGIGINRKDVIKILAENGAKINDTSLLTAVKNNNKSMVQILIRNGANVNAKNGASLLFAIVSGYWEIVDILLENNASINLKLEGNCSILHFATKTGHKKIVSALIAKGANVNALNDNKETPLHVASDKGNVEIAKILIENGADINGKPSDVTPLQNASVKGFTNVVKVLLDNGADVFVKDYENRTAFELAVSYGRLDIVKMFLNKNKINLNSKGNDDFTVLHIASQVGNLEMVKFLVNKGSDINARNVSGTKPIHIAAREGFTDIVEFFLDKGLSINEFGNINQTLLHYAATNTKLAMVEFLLSRKADINAQDNNRTTPLHLAAFFGNIEITRVLLENGAYFNIPDKFGRTPMNYTKKDKVINLFTNIEKLFKSVKSKDFSTLQNCIKAGAIVNVKNAGNETPLFHAAWKGYNEIVEILLQNKGDPNITTNKGNTPLHYAAKYSHLNVVKTLLLNGAIYNAASESGKRPEDLSANLRIIMLFQIINEAFEMVQQGSHSIIEDFNTITKFESETMKIVMNARNSQKETLIVAAINNNFPYVEELKQILQQGVSAKIHLAFILSEQDLDDEALNIYNKIFEERKILLGPNNPGTLDIQTYIGKILYKQGKYQKALGLFREIYAKQNEVLGANNKDTLISRSTIAAILHRLNDNDEAYDIYQDVYQKQVEILGPNHADTLVTEFDMALVLCNLKKYDEALNIYEKNYERSLEEEGAKGPFVLRAQNNIAMVLSCQGKHEEALKIYREVYEKKKTVFGSNHIDTLRTLHNIAGILFQLKKYHESLKAHEELFTLQKKILGPKHPETLNTQLNMAYTLHEQHKWIDALKVFKECRNLRTEVFGPNDPITKDISNKIDFINLCFKHRGTNDSDILKDLQNDVNTAVKNGDTGTVQRLLEHGFDINEKDADGITTLHYAVRYRHSDIIHLLMKHGADVTQITSKNNNTVLHIAASYNFEDVVIFLKHVKRHSDEFNHFINAKTNGGMTALHVAAKKGFEGIVNVLLEYGAIYNSLNNEDKTPLEVANNSNIVRLLRLLDELFKDAKIGNSKMIAKLKKINIVNFKIVINAHNINDKTLIQTLLINGHKDIARQLIDNNIP